MKVRNAETAKRLGEILEILRQQGSAEVNALARRFGVSGTTIRTDLTRLEKEGEIVRTHGGAMLRAASTRETDVTARKNREEKAAIARHALRYVNHADNILIDTGTTMEAFARALAESNLMGLHIFTSDILIAAILENNPNFDIHLIGGTLRKKYHYCYGHGAIEELRCLSFDTLFLATSAVDAAHGLSISNVELAELKQAMIAASRRVVLLSDASKVGRIEFRKIGDLTDADVFVTDSSLSPADREAIEALGVQVETAE